MNISILTEKYDVHTLNKPRRYISSQNHTTVRRRSPIAYKVCIPSLICRCGIRVIRFKFRIWRYSSKWISKIGIHYTSLCCNQNGSTPTKESLLLIKKFPVRATTNAGFIIVPKSVLRYNQTKLIIVTRKRPILVHFPTTFKLVFECSKQNIKLKNHCDKHEWSVPASSTRDMTFLVAGASHDKVIPEEEEK